MHKTLVIGLGNTGISVIKILKKMESDAEFIVLSDDDIGVIGLNIKNNVLEPADVYVGNNQITFVGDKSENRYAENYTNLIEDMVKDFNNVICIANLGEHLSLNILEHICKVSKNEDKTTDIAAIMPFSMEGKNKNELARKTLSSIKNAGKMSIIFMDSLIIQYPNAAVIEAFKIGDARLTDIVVDLIRK